MASYHQGAIKVGFEASADLSAKQFYFMEFSSGQLSTVNAVTDQPIGVLQDKPAAQGRVGEVIIEGPTKVVAGEALATVGTLLTVDTSGRAVAVTPGTDTTKYIVGRSLSVAGAAGDIIEAYVSCGAPARAA